MRSKGVLFHAMLCAGLVTIVACDQAQDDGLLPAERQAETEAAPGASQSLGSEAAEQMLAGELGAVDLDTMTFTVASDGVDHRFAFTEATEVTESRLGGDDTLGGADTTVAQGLLGRGGTRIIVHYRQELDGNVATRIELQ